MREDSVLRAAARSSRNAARYRGGIARFLQIPVAQVNGEVVRRYRSAMARRYGGAGDDTEEMDEHRAGD